MNLAPRRHVLDCASPLALSDLFRGRKSGRGLPQSKTLARHRAPRFSSWSQCLRESAWSLSMKIFARRDGFPNRDCVLLAVREHHQWQQVG